MSVVLQIVAPVFGLIILGFFLSRLSLLTKTAEAGLSEFVYVVAIPCLLVRTIAHASFPQVQPWGYWISYFGAAATVWILISYIALYIFKRERDETVIFGFSSAHANTALIGLPLIIQAVGPDSATPLALLLAIHLPIMTAVATLAFEGVTARGLGEVLKKVARMLVTHPILIGIYVGTAIAISKIDLSGTTNEFLNLIASSAAPCALIAIGMALHDRKITAEIQPAIAISFMKLVLHPLLAFILSRYAFSMPVAWSSVCVLFATCPSGINAYLMARRVGVGEQVASSALSLSTLAGMGTMSAWLYVVHSWPALP
ncbi:AEC family transporter [Rhizobium lusitanum]|uniref:AEC family transporter n=1 Tax=Rhizobium lusitanum TaxID=293958 RepID=A0A6L9UHS4_9HYPH|nr:AEC family transporter [Rhizobium lusitanum]NEI73676.1 AEC family transporter [Rhizobium lusitanum]